MMSKYETVYRIIKNKDSNDFNNELEFTIEPYYINEDNTKIQRKGFNSWNDITAEIFDSIYWNRKSAEMALVSYMCKTENQKAIECLVSVQKYVSDNAVYIEEEQFASEINDFIDQKISKLKGE